MPAILAARSPHDWPFWKTWKAPKPMIPTAIRPTMANSAIGPQLRPWLTLTGVIGLRGPPPAFLPGVFLAGPLLRTGVPLFFGVVPPARGLALPPGLAL